jgi:hypothetical protein
MPYIKKSDRDKLDFNIQEMVYSIDDLHRDVIDRPGLVNYTITRIVARSLEPEDGWGYHSLSRAIAVLRDAATEMERRLMAPYEDQKIRDNGDVPEYMQCE